MSTGSVSHGQQVIVPPELQESIDRWAERQPAPVSVILFGSRSRGDHGPESDWDIALLGEGESPSSDGLPSTLGGCAIEWQRLSRSDVLCWLNQLNLAHVIARDGILLHGDPLPRPKRRDLYPAYAWHCMRQVRYELAVRVIHLRSYWNLPPSIRDGYWGLAGRDGDLAARLLCRAVFSMRGVEPRKAHSVVELCDALRGELPGESLLGVLRECADATAPEQRLAAVLGGAGPVLAAACDVSFPGEGGKALSELDKDREDVCREVERLRSSDCPRSVRRFMQAGVDRWRDSAELRERLDRPPLGRDSGQSRPESGRDGSGRQEGARQA